MTFLNTLFLFALAAAAIPIIIHLLNLHRVKTVDFSTLRFLKQVQRKQMKRLQLKRWWLLLLRVLIVLLLVLTFSRPALRSLTGGAGQHEQTAAILLVDNSASTLIDENMYHIRERCYEVLAGLQDGDEIQVIPLNGGAACGLRTRSLEIARRFISEQEPTPLLGYPEEVILQALQELASSKDLNRELYICSDFAWPDPAEDLLLRSSEYSDIRSFLLPVVPTTAENIAVTAITTGDRLPTHTQPFELQVMLANFGSSPREQLIVQLFLEGNRVAERTANLPAHTAVNLGMELNLQQSGYLQGYVEIDDSQLHWDNRRYFALHVPEVYQVAIIGDDPVTNHVLAAVLQPDSSWIGRVRAELLTTAAVQSRSLEEMDVVILNSIQPSEAVFRRVGRAMEAGTGLIYFPDCERDTEAASRLASKYLGLPPLSGIAESSDYGRAWITLGPLDRRHPLLSALFEREERLETPHINRYCQFESKENVDAIIQLENGDLFAAMCQQGEGRGLFFSVSLNSEVSNFFRKGLFAPLIYRGMEWVASGKPGTSYTGSAGESISLDYPYSAGQWHLQTTNQTLFPEVLHRLNGDIIITPGTLIPGNYQVLADGREAGALTINLDPREGDIGQDCLGNWEFLMPPGSRTAIAGAELAPIVAATRWGRELWRYTLMAGLLLLLVEGVVSRRK